MHSSRSYRWESGPTGTYGRPAASRRLIVDSLTACSARICCLFSIVIDFLGIGKISKIVLVDIFSKRFVYYFAAAWSLFSMAYFMAVTFFPPPADGLRIADTILGVLIASVIGVMFAYFYGTTRASKAKDDTINKLSGG